MARPSVASWFDATVRIWRPTTAVETDAIGAESETYTPQAVVGARLNRSKTSERASAGGLTTIGTLRWYGLPTIDVQPRDLCEILTGPDAGPTWEVDQIPVRPANHHCQVDCVEWHGVLPDVEESS